MANNGDKSAIEAQESGHPGSGNPDTGMAASGPDILVDIAPAHMFGDGPQTMLLGPEDAGAEDGE